MPRTPSPGGRLSETSHDPGVCFCDVDLDRACSDGLIDPLCGCPCQKCRSSRDRLIRLKRLGEIETRLLKAGIDPSDLAELLRLRIADSFEGIVKTMVEEAIRNELDGVMLVSRVRAKVSREK